MDIIQMTLNKYAAKHRADNPDHYIIVYGNFTECETCRDHAHYWKPEWVIRHNSDYSLHERINVNG